MERDLGRASIEPFVIETQSVSFLSKILYVWRGRARYDPDYQAAGRNAVRAGLAIGMAIFINAIEQQSKQQGYDPIPGLGALSAVFLLEGVHQFLTMNSRS